MTNKIAVTKEGKQLVFKLTLLTFFVWLSNTIASGTLAYALLGKLVDPLITGKPFSFGNFVGWLLLSGFAFIVTEAYQKVIGKTMRKIKLDNVNFKEGIIE